MKFGTATLVKDIIWYEGPLLSLYKQDDKLYLLLWADVDEKEHHWYITETDEASMNQYYAKEITLLDIMQKSAAIYKGTGMFVDKNTDCEQVDFKDLDKNTTPTDQSYYDESLMMRID